MKYTIFAGVNGSGKSTLYNMYESINKYDLGIRINIDEIVKLLGDWRDELIQFKASREAVKQIRYCIDNKLPFNQETTLSGKSIIKTIKEVKDIGYHVELNYIYVDDVEILKERIRSRVNLGGHGIEDKVVERRFVSSIDNLAKVIPFCDKVRIYNNNDLFDPVVDIKNNKIVYRVKNLVAFIEDILNNY